MELRIPEGRALMHYLSLPVADPAGRSLLYMPQKKEERFSPCPATAQPMRNYHIQPMRSCYYPALLLCSSELLFEAGPPNFLPSSIKACFSPFFSRLAYDSPYFACPELQLVCCSQMNSFCW